ncbi:MAG TPA: polysaccharide biosynthesis/export family protein [Kiritimatiellia bacterium]|nr:polysaccharide biosynthesis/export family protein [Kiritimatiellia bacterium]HMP35306.1 polysaccharide biosynthesis/export family protein [Kiritimatiellia bacterium]
MRMSKVHIVGVMLALAVAALTGCVSRSSDAGGADEGLAAATARPALAMSMSRAGTDGATSSAVAPVIPPRPSAPTSAPAPAPVLPVIEPVSQPLASMETGVTFYRFKSGDPVVIHLRGIYPKDEAVEDIIDEDGNVTIPLIGDIPAAGKSTSQLEADITRMYIEGGYYRSITVNVVMPSPFYFIRGEIRSPGRFPVVSGVTILQAIAAAGGYTEFANQRNVQLIRGKTTTTINMRDIERNPERDIRLESGDVIVVNRSIL